MSLRLSSGRTPRGTDAAAIRKWGMIFLTIGIVGQCILQNRLLNMNSVTGNELLGAMESDPMVMPLLTAALICKIIETCAAPLFAFLLVEGFQRTRSFEKYLIRVGAVALISELPYNLAYSGRIFELSSRNPVFGLFICMVMLYFYTRYPDKGMKNFAMKALITLAAFLWCLMLHIDQGICLVVMVAMLWYARSKSNERAVLGFCSAMVCTLFDMYYIGSCMAFIMLHRYDEERGEQNEKLNYAFYPVVLLVVGIVGFFL